MRVYRQARHKLQDSFSASSLGSIESAAVSRHFAVGLFAAFGHEVTDTECVEPHKIDCLSVA